MKLQLKEMVDSIFADFGKRVSHTLTSGEGLGVRHRTPEEARLLQEQAQRAKAAVDPTVASLEAQIDIIKAETTMTVAGIKYTGAEVEALADKLEAVADLSDVVANASPRAQAAISRMNENALAFANEFEKMLDGDSGQQSNRAIEQAPQQKFLYASR